jgi:DNA-binding response OmpR family regulator
MRVLLVEDEAALADVLARSLRGRGEDVAVAATAEDALAQLKDALPDVLVIDVNLPDRTGWDILRRLSLEQRMAVRVIVISAAPISAKRIAEFQPLRHLQKPFPIGALVRLLNAAPPSYTAQGGDAGDAAPSRTEVDR